MEGCRPWRDGGEREREARAWVGEQGQMVTRKAIQSGIGKIEANGCGCETVPLPVYPEGEWERGREKGRGRRTSAETGSNATVCRDARLLSRIIARLVSRVREATS